jgi:hypothetical protein
MRLFALALATAMTIAAVPAGTGTASAQPSIQLAQVDVRIHTDRHDRDWRRDRYRDRHRYGYRRYGHHGCRTVVIREHRRGETIVRRIKRCS